METQNFIAIKNLGDKVDKISPTIQEEDKVVENEIKMKIKRSVEGVKFSDKESFKN